MTTRSILRISSGYLAAPLALLLFAGPAVSASKPSQPKAPSKPAGGGGGSHPQSAQPHGGGGGASHGATTSSHGPTTSSHGPTTSSHGPTTSSHGPTTSSHGVTTSSHGEATTAGHGGATTAGHGEATTAGHGGATTATGHTTGGAATGHAGGSNTAAGGRTGGNAAAGGRTAGGATATGHAGGSNAAAGGHAGGAAGGSASGGRTFGKNASAGGHTASPGAGHVKTVGGSPVAKNHTVVQTKSGSTVVRRPGGKVATVHDAKRGVEVHHGLAGGRRVVAERPDHSRVVAVRGGHGYVQRPYRYHGHEYARRSYYYHGRYYHAYYGRYYYHGVWVNPYYPTYYYPPAYYGWVYNPWVTPVAYGWGWAGNPWYGYYGAYFTPYPVYASASLWLTDYIIANSLMAAYQARLDAQAQAAALDGAAPLSPEVKQLIADEVKSQIALENSESKTAGNQNAEPNDASSSIQRLLDDGHAHVFVAGQDLDVVDADGNECALSEGDAIQLTGGQIAPDATSVSLAVLASKGGKECPKGALVAVQLTDLQEMQNHMRQTIDQGMQELQTKQGKGGLPAAPSSARSAPVESAMASSAPPPPPEQEVASEINKEAKEGDAVEQQDTSEAAAGGPNDNTPPAEAPSIQAGQSIDEVTAALGQPKEKVNLGAKQIYVYKDLKVTFVNGKVTDVQ